jgi:ABC-type amino acid transport substrate-binding protein
MLNRSIVGNFTVSNASGQYFTFDQLYGYCVDLARLICKEKLEISCKFRIVKDNSLGNKPENNQPWNGMIGELVRHEVDLAIAPLTITSERESAVDFSKPWMNLGISILISKPEKPRPSVFSFMNPLSKDIWMCVIFAYIGVSVILFLVSRFSPYEWNMENEEILQLSNKFSILNTLFFALAAFMQQGVDFIPR